MLRVCVLVFVLASCKTTLPPVSGCTPATWRCTDDGRPETCSASQRWEPAGERSCPSIAQVCVVEATAHCAPMRDAGVEVSQ